MRVLSNLNMKNKKAFYVSLLMGLATGALIVSFLNSKIIDIHRGTHDGGIIAAAGSAAIIICMISFGLIVFKLIRLFDK